jgi:hypothetical protein
MNGGAVAAVGGERGWGEGVVVFCVGVGHLGNNIFD